MPHVLYSSQIFFSQMLIIPTLLIKDWGMSPTNYMLEVKGSFGSKGLMQKQRFEAGRDVRISAA